MRLHSKAILMVMALGLAACTNPGRFGAGGAGGAGGADINAGGLGSASDPNSPAYFQQTIGDRVLFAVDQHTLSSEAIQVLSLQARWLANNPEYTALIEGHADEQGTQEYNLALSARRANSVMEYLVSQGVSPSRLRTVPYGKLRPIEVCSEEACYSQNRRAVTVLGTSGLS